MEEGNVQALGTLAGSLVDKADAGSITLGKSFSYAIFYGKCYVVYTSALVLDELGDGALLRCGLEELNLGFAYHKERGAHLLVFYCLDVVALQTQYVLVVGECLLDALDSNAEVFESCDFLVFCIIKLSRFLE